MRDQQKNEVARLYLPSLFYVVRQLYGLDQALSLDSDDNQEGKRYILVTFEICLTPLSTKPKLPLSSGPSPTLVQLP